MVRVPEFDGQANVAGWKRLEAIAAKGRPGQLQRGGDRLVDEALAA